MVNSSKHPPAQRHLSLHRQQHDAAVRVRHAEHQHFRVEAVDLARAEVDRDRRRRRLPPPSRRSLASCRRLGGFPIGVPASEEDSIRLIRSAIDAGINFMDAWDYHDGTSELRMGKALQDGYRKKVFLMTKIDLVHLRTLEVAKGYGFRFDAVQMPVNCFDAHFRSFSRLVLPVLAKERIGALCMKPIGNGDLLKAEVVTAPECLRFSLSLASGVVITGTETEDRLKQALDVVKNFKPLSEEELTALLKKTREATRTGKYEKFKTGVQYDGTAKHPEWLD